MHKVEKEHSMVLSQWKRVLAALCLCCMLPVHAVTVEKTLDVDIDVPTLPLRVEWLNRSDAGQAMVLAWDPVRQVLSATAPRSLHVSGGGFNQVRVTLDETSLVLLNNVNGTSKIPLRLSLESTQQRATAACVWRHGEQRMAAQGCILGTSAQEAEVRSGGVDEVVSLQVAPLEEDERHAHYAAGEYRGQVTLVFDAN
jgi:hypothetical protein